MNVLLIQDGPHWFIGQRTNIGASLDKIDDCADLSPEELADLIVGQLGKLGIDRSNIVLGLASNSCLPAAVVLEHSSGARDRTVLKYTLEESLPLSAEDMEADFQFMGSSGLGVAVDAAALAPLVRELEQRGVAVQSITTTALLAVQSCIGESSRHGATVILWQDENTVELVLVERSIPRGWVSVPADAESLVRELQVLVLSLGKPLEAVALSLADGLFEAAAEVLPVRRSARKEQLSLKEAASFVAADVASGRLTPWFELRRGQLGTDDPRRPVRGVLRFLSLAAATFLICVSVALIVRTGRFREQTLSLQEEQARIYQQAFPNERVPAGPRSRLESEVAKLAGRTGQGEPLPSTVSTLRLLRDFLAALPKDLRYRVVDFRIEQGRLSLEMEVRSHTDADVIASALRTRGFTVEPPRSEQLPQRGVAIRLTAIARQAEKSPVQQVGKSSQGT